MKSIEEVLNYIFEHEFEDYIEYLLQEFPDDADYIKECRQEGNIDSLDKYAWNGIKNSSIFTQARSRRIVPFIPGTDKPSRYSSGSSTDKRTESVRFTVPSRNISIGSPDFMPPGKPLQKGRLFLFPSDSRKCVRVPDGFRSRVGTTRNSPQKPVSNRRQIPGKEIRILS